MREEEETPMDRKRMPPVPEKNRSPKGPGSDPDTNVDDPVSESPENIDQVGERGNIRQNTSNQQDKR
jgi:hypothetical protein